MTLTEFVTARLDDWHEAAEQARWAMQDEWFTTADDKVDEFVRLMSPARVLAQVAAMRRIVAMYERAAEYEAAEPTRSAAWVAYREERAAFQRALEALAAIWSDHEAYDPAWAPEGE